MRKSKYETFSNTDSNIQDAILSGKPLLASRSSKDGRYPLSERTIIDDDDVFHYDSDADITANFNDIKLIVNYFEAYIAPKYKAKHDYYVGRHHKVTERSKRPLNKPDNRLVFNLPKKLVSTFNGYFSGEPVDIKHQPSNGDTSDTTSDKIQSWLSSNDYGDVFSEWAKQADIYGRSYLYVYETIAEDGDSKREQKMAVCSPRDTLVVYDDSVECKPLFAIRYSTSGTGKTGSLITPSTIYDFDTANNDSDGNLVIQGVGETASKENSIDFVGLPVIELAEDSDRAGIFDDSINLIDAIDNVLSAKGNDSDALSESYMVVTGDQLTEEQLDLIRSSYVINPYVKDAGPQMGTPQKQIEPKVSFISPDPHDEAKENFLNRAIDMVYQASQVVNLNDSSLGMSAQAISGVALLQRYQPMQARAKVKSHKMDKALRQLFTLLFAKWGIDANVSDLTFDHKQSIPHNELEEAQTVQALDGQISDATKIGYLSKIDDPEKELERLKAEDADNVEKTKTEVIKHLTDQQKSGVEHGTNAEARTATNTPAGQSGQPD